MPWWIWVVLAAFMLVVLVAGLAYAALRLWHGFRKVSDTGARIGECLAAMGRPSEAAAVDEPPSFTQPLQAAADRYADAHADVVRRREARRARHVEAWARWRRFNG